MSKLRIAEIFESIQGEGVWLGTPSTFVRVSGCNLRCTWCDTPYASWRPEGPSITVADILERVSPSINHVVLTGGEPMLFDAIEDLAEQLKTRGHTITIETAGTVFRRLPCDLMSISPKLGNSTPGGEAGAGWTERHEATRLNFATLQDLIDNYNYQLKFVVNPDTGEDAAEIDSLLGSLRNADPGQVLLMAEGTDSETLHRRQRMLVDVCMQRGWRLTPRLHIDLFGNSKGT
jgi:7-carboxy-7-deazaguanine synthase